MGLSHSLCLTFESNTDSQLLQNRDQMCSQLLSSFVGRMSQEENIKFPANRPGLK